MLLQGATQGKAVLANLSAKVKRRRAFHSQTVKLNDKISSEGLVTLRHLPSFGNMISQVIFLKQQLKLKQVI